MLREDESRRVVPKGGTTLRYDLSREGRRIHAYGKEDSDNGPSKRVGWQVTEAGFVSTFG
jgi:hypothetical protein